MEFEILVEIVYDDLGLTFPHVELNHVLLHDQCQNPSFFQDIKSFIKENSILRIHTKPD